MKVKSSDVIFVLIQYKKATYLLICDWVFLSLDRYFEIFLYTGTFSSRIIECRFSKCQLFIVLKKCSKLASLYVLFLLRYLYSHTTQLLR